MTQDKRTKFNAQISEEAAAWFVDFRLGDIDAFARREFDAWIRSSPEHLRAYLEIAAIWNEGSSLSAHRDLDSAALIAFAQREGNVVPLELDPPITQHAPQLESNILRSRREERGRDPRGKRARLFAVAASIFLATAALTAYFLAPRGVYETAVGERRILTLEDGSSVELDSRSRIRVRFARNQRDVELLEGQVLFHVAKDPHRPFIVHSDTVRVRAVGTQFDVNRKTTGTTVTVVEGRVAVYRDATFGPGTSIAPIETPVPTAGTASSTTLSPRGEKEGLAQREREVKSGSAAGAEKEPALRVPGAGSAGIEFPGPGAATASAFVVPNSSGQQAAIFLSAGDQLTVSDQASPSQPQHASPETATAWTQGQLVLDGATLAEVAEEFNRYSSRRLIAEDHEEHPLRLSGVFATDPDFLLRYLRQRPDITVQETPTEVRIIHHD